MVREGRLWLLIFAVSTPLGLILGVLQRSPATAARARAPQAEAADADPAVRESVFPPIVSDAEFSRVLASATSLDEKVATPALRHLRSVPLATKTWWAALERKKIVDPETEATLALLDDIARQARDPNDRASLVPTVVDAELSARAKRHADFLELNDDVRDWPQGHHEVPGQPGASPEGDAAGRHSVISFTNPTVRSAIGGWMATYYHRLPLLEGALAVGWGPHGYIQVLDATTLAETGPKAQVLRWPAEGARDVPLRFDMVGERPEPAPGLSERFLGYPITLQVADLSLWVAARGELRVHRQEGWVTVPCLFSSPRIPLQPLAVPPDAACLLPRGPLDPAAEHEVTFTLARGRTFRWTFWTADAVRDVEGLLSVLKDPEGPYEAARSQLRALDLRWMPALSTLDRLPALTAEDRALKADVEDRIGGAKARNGGRTIRDHEVDFRTSTLPFRKRALEAAGKLLRLAGSRAADPGAAATADGDAALRLLREALHYEVDTLRAAAVDALRDSGTRHDGYAKELVGCLADDSPDVRRSALRALSELPALDDETFRACRIHLSAGDDDIAWGAAVVLNHEPSAEESLRVVLLRGATSWRPQRRREAARELARWRHDPEVSEALGLLTRDDTESVRNQARLALEGKTQE